MQEDLFGIVDLDEKEPLKKRKTPLNIHLPLGRVCVGSERAGFVCRSIPHSPNVLNRKHWAVRAKWKKAWEEEIAGRWYEERAKWREYTFPLDFKVCATISVFCIRKQDEDNAIASMKGVIDGLVQCGIIKDDGYDYISHQIQFVPVQKKNAEHIELVIKKYVRK